MTVCVSSPPSLPPYARSPPPPLPSLPDPHGFVILPAGLWAVAAGGVHRPRAPAGNSLRIVSLRGLSVEWSCGLVWHAFEMDGWNYSLSLSNSPSTFFTIPLPSLTLLSPSPPLSSFSIHLPFPSLSLHHLAPTLSPHYPFLPSPSSTPLLSLPFLTLPSSPFTLPSPSLPSLPSSPSMQAIQNLGLAVVAIVAGKIVDVKGYLVYEVFNCALLCCESTLGTQGVAWGWGIYVRVGGLTTPTVQCHASHPSIQTLLGVMC